jgi:CRP-like cAMP-binding protein
MQVNAVQRSILESGSWFAGCAPDLKTKLLAIALCCDYSEGEMLFRRGDAPDGLYAVLSGSVRIYGLDSHGKEALLTFIEAPNWIGEVSLFDKNVRTHNASAETQTKLLHFPQKALHDLLNASPQFWQDFGCLLTHKLRLSFLLLEDMALLPAPIRLAKRLVLIAQEQTFNSAEASRSPVVVNVPQESLARLLSVSRQTANQILKDLADLNLICLSYGKIEITDLPGLRAFVGGKTLS